MPSVGKPNAGSLPGKPPARLRGKNRSSTRHLVRSATNRSPKRMKDFRICSRRLKATLASSSGKCRGTRTTSRPSKKRKIDKEDFNLFVENQKRDLPVFI